MEKKMKQIIEVPKNKKVVDCIKHDEPGQQVFKCKDTGKVLKVVTVCGESKTDQSFADSHDINRLIADAERKGLLRAVGKFEGEMDDFPAYDFQEAQNMMAKARTMFEEMPAGVRTRFKDPATFMQYVNNPENREALEKMGFAKGFDNLDYRGNIINPEYGKTVEEALPDPAPVDTPQPTE
jgi:hypothetical protein